MPRSVSSVLQEAVYKNDTPRIFIVVIEITHPHLSDVLRYCSNGETIQIGGEDYLPVPFSIALPEDGETIPSSTLQIQNIDLRMSAVIRAIPSPADFKMWVVLDDDYDRVEAGPWNLKLREGSYDFNTAQLTLEGPDTFSEPFPYANYNRQDYPGL